jgi:hypothetical protein
VTRLAALATGALDAGGAQGLGAVELAIRTAMTKLGCSLLEQLLAADSGHRGARIDCGQGHQAAFVGYRPKHLDTVLGPVTPRRAYYHCGDCGGGASPKDAEVGVADASLSPGLQRMVARVGSAEPFAQARRDLTELAGVDLSVKRVERSAEADGQRLAALVEAEADAVLAGALSPLERTGPVDTLYVAMDGTGVPTAPADTKDRRGKHPDGRARTREVKLGCVFTQTGLDPAGRPPRDPDSSSYVATLKPAGPFGSLVYAEARRRGVDRAARLIVLGDGAPWIWNLAALHFPTAIEIVDLYHAREHLHALGALVAPALGADHPGWLADRLAELDRGDIPALLAAARALQLPDATTQHVDKALGYFHTNQQRMRYAHFRGLGLFVGSGAVEAGCRAVVAQRLKLSGMRWSVRGATGIVSLRCQHASGRWDDIWNRLHNHPSVA